MRIGELQTLLDRLVSTHRVPGAVLGVRTRDGTVAIGSGSANLNTGAEMTADTLFLAGSITKVWVATLAMRLIESGRLSLGSRVVDLLPGFKLADDDATGELTVWHLLTHSSGIDAADYIPDDLGRGDDAIDRYVSRLAGMGQLHRPGQFSSYSNCGYVVAGRIIEEITGLPFAQAFRDHLVAPLALERTFLSAEEAVLHRCSIGHFPRPGTGEPAATRRYLLPHSMAPAGSTLTTTVGDMLVFADLHLGSGLELMASHQIDLPVPQLGSRGLGWHREDAGGRLLLSHSGGSLGGIANLVAVPSEGCAFAAFANSAGAGAFHHELQQSVLHLLGITPPEAWTEPGEACDPEWLCGRYERQGVETVIAPGGDGLALSIRPLAPVLAEYSNGEVTTLPYVPAGPTSLRLALDAPGSDAYRVYGVGDVGGHPELLYMGLRLARRVAD